MEEKITPQFKAKITPEQVNEAIKKDAEKQKKKSMIEREGEAHNKATEKLDHQVANAESKKQEEKPKRKKREPAEVKFPVETRINNYGFIFMRKQWLAALGWAKGMKLKIHKNPDGSITIQKA